MIKFIIMFIGHHCLAAKVFVGKFAGHNVWGMDG